jgi:glycine cleavage system regulatory protein
MTTLVLNVTGSDRPGLTQALAEAVLSAGGNWLESHLSRLGGLYVGSVLIALDADRVEALRGAVQAIDGRGLEVRIAPTVETSPSTGETLTFRLVGQDRAGIVRQVTAVLAGLDVNIEAFESHISAKPHSGAPLFHLEARLRLPPALDVARVQDALEAISAEIMVDIAIGSD